MNGLFRIVSYHFGTIQTTVEHTDDLGNYSYNMLKVTKELFVTCFFIYSFRIAYTKLNRNQEALEAYQNAIRLEPENQDYQNNLQCIQQRLSEAPATSAGGFNLGAAAGASGIGNPISQLLQQNMGSPNFLQSMAQLMNNDEMQNMMSRITNSENMDAFMGMAQQMAQQLSSQNPELFDNLRRQFEHTMGGPNGSNPDPSAGNKDSSKP